jgi:hypothetical protein
VEVSILPSISGSLSPSRSSVEPTRQPVGVAQLHPHAADALANPDLRSEQWPHTLRSVSSVSTISSIAAKSIQNSEVVYAQQSEQLPRTPSTLRSVPSTSSISSTAARSVKSGKLMYAQQDEQLPNAPGMLRSVTSTSTISSTAARSIKSGRVMHARHQRIDASRSSSGSQGPTTDERKGLQKMIAARPIYQHIVPSSQTLLAKRLQEECTGRHVLTPTSPTSLSQDTSSARYPSGTSSGIYGSDIIRWTPTTSAFDKTKQKSRGSQLTGLSCAISSVPDSGASSPTLSYRQYSWASVAHEDVPVTCEGSEKSREGKRHIERPPTFGEQYFITAGYKSPTSVSAVEGPSLGQQSSTLGGPRPQPSTPAMVVSEETGSCSLPPSASSTSAD